MQQAFIVEAPPDVQQWIDDLYRQRDRFIVIKAGEKQVALLTLDSLHRLIRDSQIEQRVDAMLSRLAVENKDFKDEDVEADVSLAKVSAA